MSISKSPTWVFLLIAAAMVFMGCASKGGSSSSSEKQSKPVAYEGRVFIFDDPLPAGIDYDIVEKKISVSKKVGYGSPDIAYELLAEEARELGANAVIEAHTWLSPSLLSWASPHGEGIAIRVKDVSKLEALSKDPRAHWH
jgi:hypothetical protein